MRFRIYLLAVTLFLVIIKSLDYLRVNRSLSTFILVCTSLHTPRHVATLRPSRV